MTAWRPLAAVLLMALAAGCSSTASKGTPQESLPPLEATATTGVLRIVVVDDAIRPLGNATVTATSGALVEKGRSDAAGFVGLKGLRPGTWIVAAGKP
ncbi:MAG: hypothetical protein QOI63_1231, partial [Thermoplasmata archaeon]|nr:hypothetical protein [Thermoplasmata archaeon]